MSISEIQFPGGFGPVPVEALRNMAGLDLLTAMKEGRLPAPPIAGTLGFVLDRVEQGEVSFVARPGQATLNPMGTVHGGYTATLLDSCMGCAVHSTLKAGRGYTTLEIKVNYVRAMTEAVGPVWAEGKVIHVGGRAATAEGRLVDGAGKIYAHASTTCMVFDF